MSIGRSAALSLFREWLGRGVLVWVEATFASHVARFALRLVAVTDAELRFMSDDDLVFGYVDMRFASQATNELTQSLVVLFPNTGDPPDMIAFGEVAPAVRH